MNTEKARAALLNSRKIKGKPSDTQIRQIWRDLTDGERKEYMDKIKGDKDATSIDSRKLRGGSKRTRGDGESPDVSV